MNSNNFSKTKYIQPFILQRADPYIEKDENGPYYFTASILEYDSICHAKQYNGIISYFRMIDEL